MNKKMFILLTSLVVIFAIGIQVIFTQNSNNKQDEFTKMTFLAHLDKTEFLPLEPLEIKFKFVNTTDLTIKTIVPNFISSVKIRINESKWESDISYIHNSTVQFPRDFKPGEAVEGKILLDTNLRTLFPEAGKYRIQFVLIDGSRKSRLESQIISVKVKEPHGVNKRALEFLKKYKIQNRADVLFDWNPSDKNENGQPLLEAFVDRFGTSTYGDYATLKLGMHYFYSGQLEKATVEFEKIQNTENSLISNSAKKSLIAIEKQTRTP